MRLIDAYLWNCPKCFCKTLHWQGVCLECKRRKGETMTDYIKREDAMKTLADEYDECEFKRYAEGLFKDIPSADVAPVRHGRWEKNDDYTCSLCGYRMVVGDGAYRYCPNCGARMDGESDE